VFGLGSRAYPNFCSFGHQLDNTLKKLGGEQICGIGEGDELCGQEESFNEWAAASFKVRFIFFCYLRFTVTYFFKNW